MKVPFFTMVSIPVSIRSVSSQYPVSINMQQFDGRDAKRTCKYESDYEFVHMTLIDTTTMERYRMTPAHMWLPCRCGGQSGVSAFTGDGPLSSRY